MPRAAALVALAALLPTLAAAAAAASVYSRLSLSPGHMCGSQGRYAPFSAYEASLRHLAATVAAEVNANSCNCSNGNIAGQRPNKVVASAYCYWRLDANSSDCGACVALAFQEAQRLCPYHRQAVAVADGGACSVSFHDVHRMEQEIIGVDHTGPEMLASDASFWWVGKVAELLDPDVLVILLFQATGLACVVFLFLQERRASSRVPVSDDNLPVTGAQ